MPNHRKQQGRERRASSARKVPALFILRSRQITFPPPRWGRVREGVSLRKGANVSMDKKSPSSGPSHQGRGAGLLSRLLKQQRQSAKPKLALSPSRGRCRVATEGALTQGRFSDQGSGRSSIPCSAVTACSSDTKTARNLHEASTTRAESA